MAKASRPGGGGSLLSTARNLETASPANVENLYNSMRNELKTIQAENRAAKAALYDMPTRTKAQKAARAEAEAKYNQSVRREYAQVQAIATVQNVAVSRGIITTQRVRRNKAYGYDYETKYTWKHNGKSVD